MREVAVFDAKNRLSALIQEVLDSGEDVVITRHGQPAVRLTAFRGKARCAG
jgi:prevent-host-death family protein